MYYASCPLSRTPSAACVQSSDAVQQLSNFVIEGAEIWPIQARSFVNDKAVMPEVRRIDSVQCMNAFAQWPPDSQK